MDNLLQSIQGSITDPNGNATQYWSDDFGRKNQTGSHDTGITDYLYDEAGNLIQRFDAKETVVNYTYDALNRLTAIQFPSDPTQNVTFSYDSTSVTYGIGRLTGRVDPSGSYTFYYDGNGNLTREDKTISGILYTTQYTYNKNNVLTSITYPSGRIITYTLDGVERISEVDTTLNGNPKTLASNISYLPFGGITGLIYGNGLSLSQGYDNQYRMTSVVVGSILNLTHGYDSNGNITSALDTINPPGGEVLETQGAYSYQQGSNKLTNIIGPAPANFGYDLNGNIISENTRTLVYDLSNQLIQIWDGSTQTAAYTYNGIGQRIMKVTQTGTRIFHYDSLGHLMAETNQSGQMLGEYTYLEDQLLAMIRPGEMTYYFHNDHLGTPQALTNDSQAIAWKAAYTPFGEAVTSIQTVDNPFRFPGQYYDQETGLHYNYYRYYDPKKGRYITPDPIGLGGGINPFVYTLNNPINDVDQQGLQDANSWTYGEIRECAITSIRPRNFKPPPGLADAKATINACCSRGEQCNSVDGSNATSAVDRAAWRNIVNAKGGTDLSGGGNYMCVNTQQCEIVHRCAYCCNGTKAYRERGKNLVPTGTVSVGHCTLYFYSDPLQGWCTQEDQVMGCR